MNNFKNESENLHRELTRLDEDIVWSNQGKKQLQDRIRDDIRGKNKIKKRNWHWAPQLMTVGMFLLGVYLLVDFVIFQDVPHLNGGNNLEEPPSENGSYIISNEERAKAEKEIGEVNDESTLIVTMMYMCFQKVKIGDNNLTVPGIDNDFPHPQITKGNIAYLQEALETIEISRNYKQEGYDVKRILNRWMNGKFDDIVNEFEFLRISFSYPNHTDNSNNSMKLAQKNKREEKEYILHYFGDEGMVIHKKEWNTEN